MNKIKILKPHFVWMISSMFFFTLILILLIPTASADGQDATYDSVELKAVPPVQGVGGEVRIEATAKFFGGCCYILYAHDVKAELNTPQNISIVSSLPKTIKQFEAVAGGSPTSAKFKWTVIGDGPGTLNLTVTISTSNCGSKSSTCQITIIQAASVSNPTIFPSKPSVGESITFSTDALSGSTFIDVERTTLYVWRSNKEYSEERLLADLDTLYEIKGDFEINETSKENTNITKKRLGTGKKYPMTAMEFSNTWRVRVKDIDEEEIIYYWFSVETSDEKNITSFVYRQTIEDLEKKYQMFEMMKWGTFFTIFIGVILILGVSWSILNRPAKKLSKTSIFVLGSSFFSKPSEGKRVNVSDLSIARFRAFLFWLLIILLILSLIISFYQGLFNDLIGETGG